MSTSEEIQRLKDEGNAFYVQKDYASATSKYSDAILLDDNNAILYANRSACRLAMNQYLDALSDAHKATNIDPNYPKAWTRCASVFEAMEQPQQSVPMYEHALEALSSLSLTPANLNLKKVCEANLSKARKASKASKAPVRRPQMSTDARQIRRDAGPLPWEAAKQIVPTLIRDNNPNSSAWVIGGANEQFTEGSATLKAMKKIKRGDHYEIISEKGALESITNAIMQDQRVFRIDQGDWLIRFGDQTRFEGHHWDAWSLGPGPEKLMEDAIERLRERGWSNTRPAVATVVRNWIMSGFMSGKIKPNYTLAIELFRNALSFIDWGRKVWKDVPKTERGTIFDLTFRRGVWNMLLNSIMDAFSHDNKRTDLLQSIFEEAEGIIQDVEEHPYNAADFEVVPDPGFGWAFFKNIQGNALACKGFYHSHTAKSGEDIDAQAKYDHYMSAMECYLAAADCYPEDDENHPWYLYCAYQCMPNVYDSVTTMRAMKILERIRRSVPKMRKIWCLNPTRGSSADRDPVYAQLQKDEANAIALVARGEMTLSEPFPFKKIRQESGEGA